MNPESPTPPSAVDYVAREQVKGLRGDFHEFRDETRSGFINLDRKMEAGLDKIQSTLKDVSAATPKFGVETMKTIVSVGAVGVGAFWLTINLLVNPLAEKLGEHIKRTDSMFNTVSSNAFEVAENKRDLVNVYERATHEGGLRDNAQQLQLDALVKTTELLSERQLKIITDAARAEGRADALKSIITQPK
jgi:hypothetical protein